MDDRTTLLCRGKHFSDCHMLGASHPNSLGDTAIGAFPPESSTVVMMIAAESLGAARAAEPVSMLTVSTGVRPDCG